MWAGEATNPVRGSGDWSLTSSSFFYPLSLIEERGYERSGGG